MHLFNSAYTNGAKTRPAAFTMVKVPSDSAVVFKFKSIARSNNHFVMLC